MRVPLVVVLVDVLTDVSSVVSILAVLVSFDAQPAKNMKPAIRIASFCIVLLFVRSGRLAKVCRLGGNPEIPLHGKSLCTRLLRNESVHRPAHGEHRPFSGRDFPQAEPRNTQVDRATGDLRGNGFTFNCSPAILP